MRKGCKKRERENAIQPHAHGETGWQNGAWGSDTNAKRNHRRMVRKLFGILAERQRVYGWDPDESFGAEVVGGEKLGSEFL